MYSLSSKELHAQQGKHHDEEEEEEEQTDDGLHGVQEGNDEIPQRVPVPVRNMQSKPKFSPPYCIVFLQAEISSV